MPKTKALLVGVSKYFLPRCTSLPLVINDLFAMRDALVRGLNVAEKDIVLCGEKGTVEVSEFIKSIKRSFSEVEENDNFIFYFSGHGAKDCLVLSDKCIQLQELINLIGHHDVKSKILILDSCNSGGFKVDGVAEFDISTAVEKFIGSGYAVMASCGPEQESGFDNNRNISLYTRFVCDALTSNSLIRRGRKSLEMINEAIKRYADISNRSGKNPIQNPVFRSSINGTIYFNVKEYNPYQKQEIYEETDDYIIYDVEPMHHANKKRIAVKIILRTPSSEEQVVTYTEEIIRKLRFVNVYNTKKTENRLKDLPVNMIQCDFGYNEDDIIKYRYIYTTRWVDSSMDKTHWYSEGKNRWIIRDIYCQINTSYAALRKMAESDVKKEDAICLQKQSIAAMINFMNQYISIYREYTNKMISMEELLEKTKGIQKSIHAEYIKQTELPILPSELHEWAEICNQIADVGWDLTLFYNKKNLDNWNEDSRRFLTSKAIKDFEELLEKFKNVETQME